MPGLDPRWVVEFLEKGERRRARVREATELEATSSVGRFPVEIYSTREGAERRARGWDEESDHDALWRRLRVRGSRARRNAGMTLPPLISLDCECAEVTREDPARICGPCAIMARVRDLLEIAFRFEGDEVAYGTEQRTADALQSLLDAYRDEADRRGCPDAQENRVLTREEAVNVYENEILSFVAKSGGIATVEKALEVMRGIPREEMADYVRRIAERGNTGAQQLVAAAMLGFVTAATVTRAAAKRRLTP